MDRLTRRLRLGSVRTVEELAVAQTPLTAAEEDFRSILPLHTFTPEEGEEEENEAGVTGPEIRNEFFCPSGGSWGVGSHQGSQQLAVSKTLNWHHSTSSDAGEPRLRPTHRTSFTTRWSY